MVRRVVPAGIRGARTEYTKYLETEHWRNTRHSALLLARFRCAECKSGDSLEVHHLHYRSLGSENVLTDLLVLCAVCHQKKHAGRGWKLTEGGNWVRFLSGGRCITVFRRDDPRVFGPAERGWAFVADGVFSEHRYASAGLAMDAAMGWAS